MNEQSINQMKQMRLHGMYRAYQTCLLPNSIPYSNDDLIAFLLQAEWDDRHERRIARLTRNAKFRYRASVEEIIFDERRNIDRNVMQRLFTCDFIHKRDNILLTGSTGVGKSYIASALGYQACSRGYKVLYYNINRLFTRLKMSKADGSYLKELNKIEKQDLLILDDFGLKPLDQVNRHFLMEIVEDRHGKKATMIASQLPVEAWHQVIGEQTIADAIMDRIIHTAHRVELLGESMRKKQKKNN